MGREKILAVLLAASPLVACGNPSRIEGGDVMPVCDPRISSSANAVRIVRYVEELQVLEARNSSSPGIGDGTYSRLEGHSLSIPMLVERERGCTTADWDAARNLLSERN